MRAATFTEQRNNTSYLGVLRALKTCYSAYIFIVPNIKLNCRKKKERDSGLSRTYSEKEKSIYFYSMGLRVANWDQNIWILKCYNNQQFLLIHTVHRQNLHYYLTIGLIICSVKIVGFIVKAVTLSPSASVDFSRLTSDREEPFRCLQGGQACWLAIQYARLTISLNQ